MTQLERRSPSGERAELSSWHTPGWRAMAPTGCRAGQLAGSASKGLRHQPYLRQPLWNRQRWCRCESELPSGSAAAGPYRDSGERSKVSVPGALGLARCHTRQKYQGHHAQVVVIPGRNAWVLATRFNLSLTTVHKHCLPC